MNMHSQNLVGSASLPILTPRKSTILVREKRALGKPELTHETVLKYFDYNKETSTQLRWSVSRGGCNAGDIAGSVSPTGYRSIFVDYWSYRASRLIWYYVTGEWPENLVDHKNGVRDDNRWSNLRDATYAQNNQNRGHCRRNTSGRIGVHPLKEVGKWGAEIGVGGKNVRLGCFECKDDAIAARCAAEKHYYGDFAKQVEHYASDSKGGVL